MLPLLLALALSNSVDSANVTGIVSYRGKPARDAVVYLEGVKKPEPLKNVVIDQRGKRFIPSVTVVTPGTSIEFPNNDSVFHNVYAAFEASTFDLGEYPRGAVKHKRFDKCGVVSLLCNIHSEMGAFILVVNTPYFAVSDSKGRFNLRSIPPGAYTLRGWNAAGGGYSQSIRVDGDSEMSLELKRK